MLFCRFFFAVCFMQIIIFSEHLTGMGVHDVALLSLGVAVAGEVMSFLILRNTRIPCTESCEYKSIAENQQAFLIEIFEGERPLASQNSKLCQFLLDGVEQQYVK